MCVDLTHGVNDTPHCQRAEVLELDKAVLLCVHILAYAGHILFFTIYQGSL